MSATVVLGLVLGCAPPGIATDGSSSTSTGGSSTSESNSGETGGETGAETGGETGGETGPAVIDCSLATRVIEAEDTMINSAAQMAALADVVEVRGDLWIRDGSMTELIGGNCIERVTGDLRIVDNLALERIDAAFERLRFIGTGEPNSGGLTIDDNPALVSVTSFHALEQIDSRSFITNNDALVEARFDALRFVGENFTIAANLPDLHGFSALTEVAGTLTISSASIVDLDGLQNLSTVGATYGGLRLTNNAALLSLDGLTLTSIPRLWIYANDALVDLGGLESLESITRELVIEENEALVSLHGLENLSLVHGQDHLDGLLIIANPSLTSLAGLEGLATVDQHVFVCDNPTLTDLGALAGLDALGRLTVIYNDALAGTEADAIAAALPGIEWVKNDANGVLDGFWWLKDGTCPWNGDFICDESAEFQGDVGVECLVDCCDIWGPTHLCAVDSDDDCQDEPIGPP